MENIFVQNNVLLHICLVFSVMQTIQEGEKYRDDKLDISLLNYERLLTMQTLKVNKSVFFEYIFITFTT